VVSSLAFEFLHARAEQIFPGLQSCFTSVNITTVEKLSLARTSRGRGDRDFTGTVDTILRLQPDTVRIVSGRLVTG